MKLTYLLSLTCAVLFIVASCTDKKEVNNAPSQEMTASSTVDTVFNIVGKKVEIEYPIMSVEASYTSDSTLHWKTTRDGLVSEGDEQVTYKKVGNGLYFINWIEKDGITVSQVIDFNKKIISAFMSYHNPDSERGQRSGDAFEGKFRVVE